MKAFLLLAALLPAVGSYAVDTAYAALRTVGKLNGKEVLNHVVEVRGTGGAPDPAAWHIILEDSTARGGIREMEIQHGKMVSERTPTARTLGAAMNFNQLNLDTDGVFTIANDEAKKAGVLFDHVDYTLHSGGRSGAPVWRIDLFAAQHGRVASLDIAADTGAVLHRDLGSDSSAASDSHIFAQPQPPPPAYRPQRDDPDDFDRPLPPAPSDDDYDGPGFLERLKNRFEKRGRQFDNFFNGRGWHQ